MFVLGVISCAKLNAAYVDTEAAEAETTNAPDPSGVASGSAESGSDVTTDVVPTSGPGTTEVEGPDPPRPEDTGHEESGDDTSTIDHNARRVMLLWASGDVVIGEGEGPESACQTAPPKGDTRLCEGPPRALVSTGVMTLEQRIAELGPGLVGLQVHGLLGSGADPIADSPLGLLGGLLDSLSDGGTGLDAGDTFWTGVSGNCEGWIAPPPGAIGTIGSSTAVDAAWYIAGSESCTEPLPVLCYCRSILDPF